MAAPDRTPGLCRARHVDHLGAVYGCYIEPFAIDWHERRTGQPLTCRGIWVPHPELRTVGATLDAYREADDAVVDCKAPGAYRTIDNVIGYYTPQMVVQRACVRAQKAMPA